MRADQMHRPRGGKVLGRSAAPAPIGSTARSGADRTAAPVQAAALHGTGGNPPYRGDDVAHRAVARAQARAACDERRDPCPRREHGRSAPHLPRSARA